MKAKINIRTLAFVTLAVLTFVRKTFADDGILIAHGDHFEMVCRDDGLVDVYHTILESANITKNVTSESTYSFDGTLVGDVDYEYDPEIYESEVLHSSKDGISMIFVNFNATLKPLKFTKLKLKYTVDGLLKKDVNGTWHFRHAFNTDSVSPAEVVLKIPKPPIFNKVIIEDTVPAPHVFIEESHYYVLVWKSPLFTFGDISTTYIDVSYKTVSDWESIFWWWVLTIASAIASGCVGFVMGKFGGQISGWLGFKAEEQKPKVNEL